MTLGVVLVAGLACAFGTMTLRALLADVLGRVELVAERKPWSCNLCMSTWTALACASYCAAAGVVPLVEAPVLWFASGAVSYALLRANAAG